jgi:protease IV
MKPIYESVFMSALRALIVTFFGVIGISIALMLIGLASYGIYSLAKEESYSSKVKLLPDAKGHRSKLKSSAPVILQINIDGKIGSGKLTGKEIEEILLQTREDVFKERHVKGILLVINSPGGSVNESDLIYRHIKRYKEQYNVPVFAYVQGLCASGGYYIACLADKIYASDVSLVGSIGVLTWPPFVNLVDAINKIGVTALTLSAGVGKDELGPFHKWKPDEQKHYQILIDFFYKKFIEVVSVQRSLEEETIINTLGAKVYPAPEAVSLKLIDSCCETRSVALSALVKAAKIEGKYQVVAFETKSWWKKWLKWESTSPLITGKVKHELLLPTYDENPFSYIFIP